MTPSESSAIDQLRLARRALKAAYTHVLQAGPRLPPGAAGLAEKVSDEARLVAELAAARLRRTVDDERGMAW